MQDFFLFHPFITMELDLVTSITFLQIFSLDNKKFGLCFLTKKRFFLRFYFDFFIAHIFCRDSEMHIFFIQTTFQFLYFLCYYFRPGPFKCVSKFIKQFSQSLLEASENVVFYYFYRRLSTNVEIIKYSQLYPLNYCCLVINSLKSDENLEYLKTQNKTPHYRSLHIVC